VLIAMLCMVACLYQVLPRTLESVVKLPESFDVNFCNGTDGLFQLFDLL